MFAVIAGMAIFTSVVLGMAPDELMEMEMAMRPETVSEMMVFAAGFMSQVLVFMFVGFTIAFISSDFESGTIRNPFAVGVGRVHYLVAKFVMILITCAAFLIAGIGFAGLAYLPFEPLGTDFDFGLFLAGVGITYLGLVAQTTLFMAVAVVTRKIGTSLGIILGYITFDLLVGTFVMMLGVEEGLVARLASFLPHGAGPVSNAVAVGAANTSDVIVFVAMMAGLVVVSAALGVRSLVKKDI